MKKELTEEEVTLMHEVKEEWINKMLKPKAINSNDYHAACDYIYNLMGEGKPIKILLDSPLACQFAANALKIEKLDLRGGPQVGPQVGMQVGMQVSLQVSQQVWQELCQELWQQVDPQVWDKVDQRVGFSGGGINFGWCAYYDFFARIGIFKHQKFQEYMKHLDNMGQASIYLKGIVITSKFPTQIHRNENNDLHSLEHPAVKYADGYCQHYIQGVFFEHELWEKISSGSISFKEIIGIGNIEQRMIALKYKGMEELLEEMPHEIIEKSERGNELIKVTGIFDQERYFLRYYCPSTMRCYISGVPNKEAYKGADAAMAWKHHMTLNEYQNMEVES